ncbi:hypothetical protein SEA_NEFERTHENA_11 [Microbacterium phage Neferthena]|uniref:Uncharacterized protein n=1 Tax=Microbacterium phage Neferthena TaxID=2301539 RepID=A0A385D3J0_9CAUD|nr:hypothetical protein HOT92_gp11 [Microbacterium phage Neferthena]AXQ52875.1 hypothetical protein SEA_NEFERTHENA_11 [Microbacterium phage Neferthena]
MVMSTQISRDAAALLAGATLHDSIQVMNVGEPVTVGPQVTRSLTPVGDPIPGLVQTTVLANAVEGISENIFSVKVAQGTTLLPGQAVKVVSCVLEPALVGKVLLLDKVSENGAALIRKAVASDTTIVNQEGKEALA